MDSLDVTRPRVLNGNQRPARVIARRTLGWRDAVRPAIYWIGFIPAAWTFYLALSDQLGADPMKTLERALGLWSLKFIVIGLAITPLRRLGGPSLLRYRRAVGLLAFFYAAMHFTVYLVLDRGLDMAAIGRDLVKRPYIMAGMAAFAILLPLAVTSNNALVRRLGPAWNRLHRWVYAAAALGAFHFLLVVKAWPAEPIIYAGIVAALLLSRIRLNRAKRRARSR
jgi:sulfoxide reductase heme-binding subunit YedZ